MNPYKLLFSPLNINSITLKNRLVMPPMGTNLPTRTGEVTQELIDHYAARARGGVALVTVEGTTVHSSGRGFNFQLCADRDELIPGLADLAGAIKEVGAVALLQLHHGGRNTDVRVSGRPPLAPSALRSPVSRVTPEAMSLDQIELMVEAYGRAAERALEAGFDGVELHGAHEYLIHQFLSPYCNRRTDDYGGSEENRLRFPLEVIARIRRRLKNEILSFRLNGSDYVPGGLTIEEGVRIAQALVRAGVDLISVTAGLYETPHKLIPPLDTPRGTHLDLAAEVKKRVDRPVVGVGRIIDPAQAELALRRNQADLIAVGRALLADPEWPRKAREGRWKTIRRCVGCNQGCIDHMFSDRPVTCLYNPRTGHERELAPRPCTRSKRVVVVGAGPAGLEAARALDRMGHRVILLEKEHRIGGQVNLASRAPGKEEFRYIIDYYRQVLKQSGIDLRLGTEADARAVLDLDPDEVVVATGSVPLKPDLPGLDDPGILTAHQVLSGEAEAGRRVVILGGGNVGLETAYLLLSQGREVTVMEMGQQVGRDLGPARRYLLNRKLRDLKLKRLVSCKIRRVHSDRVSYVRYLNDGRRTHQELTGIDSLIVALGVRPQDRLALELEEVDLPVHLIGDALTPGKILDAAGEGARVAQLINGQAEKRKIA